MIMVLATGSLRDWHLNLSLPGGGLPCNYSVD
jgi:hypothetical protein